MIAITFALPAESSDFVRSIDRRRTAVVHTGVGGNIAARKVDTFLQHQRPDILISSGFAGALHDGLRVGDLIFSENFSDPQVLRCASELLITHNVHRAKLFTANAIADSVAEREQLRRAHGADAIDMESEVIASACAAHGIPMLSLRVITDTPRDPLPAPPAVLFDLQRQRTSFLGIFWYCATHPKAISRLIHFSQDINMARAELTSALLTLLREEKLLSHSHPSGSPNESKRI